jgi:large repetitive protein
VQATMHHRSGSFARTTATAMVRSLATLGFVAIAVTSLVMFAEQPATSVDVRSSSVWLSGEQRGRVVLAAARGQRPSLAVALVDGAAQYDIAALTDHVVVHDRIAGAITILDRRSGTKVREFAGPVPVDERRAVVAAGDVAYVIDVERTTVSRIDPDGSDGTAVTLETGFSAWAATRDGLLWLLDDDDGSYSIFNGTSVDRRRFTEPGTTLSITTVGNDPVVFDPSGPRLRWLRRNVSVDVPGMEELEPSATSDEVILGDPDPSASCVAVLTRSTLSCVSADGPVRQLSVTADLDLADAHLVSDTNNAVITRLANARVTMFDWSTGESTSFDRSSPSARRPIGDATAGTIVVDDPGSRFAFTVDDGRVYEMDKYSRRTVVVNPDGSAADGFGNLDETAEVAVVLPPENSTGERRDEDGLNDPPIALPDHVITRSGRAISIEVLANDIDPDGDPIVVTNVDVLDPGDGAATIVRGSTIRYSTPPSTVDRAVTFSYRIADLGGLIASSDVTVEIVASGRNTAPELGNDVARTTEGMPIDLLVTANDVDAEGDPLTIIQLARPDHGRAAIARDGFVRYEPETGFVGSDRFSYTVTDGFGATATADVAVIVDRQSTANRAPHAVDDRAAAVSGRPTRVFPLGNDSDADGDPLRIVSVSTAAGLDVTIGTAGALDVLASEKVTGLVTFDYTIADPDGQRDTGSIALVVEPRQLGAVPIAIDDYATAASRAITINVVANDIDPGGGQLVIDDFNQPAGGTGTVVASSPTAFQFTPTLQFVGTARFNYSVQNVSGLSSQAASVFIEVTPPTGSGPVANPDRVEIARGTTAVIAALANDTHPDGLEFGYIGQPTGRGGAAALGPNNTILFTPATTELGTYVITYGIQDSLLRRSFANILVTVVEAPSTNRPPNANDDLLTVAQGVTISIDALANDSDPDGDAISLIQVDAASVGQAILESGRIRYTPPPLFTGVAAMSYTVVDPDGLTDRATAFVAVNDRSRSAPIPSDDLVSITRGSTVSIDPLANDVDPDGTNAGLGLVRVSQPSPAGGPTVTVSARTVRIAAGNVDGTFQAVYVITDADDLRASGTITIIVQPPPDEPPVARDDVANSNGATLLLNVLDNDTDDGGTIELVAVGAVSPASAGEASIVGSQIRFDPAAGFSGTALFSYTIRDQSGLTDTGLVAVAVVACPTVAALPPIATSTRFQTPISISLFGGGRAPDGIVAIGIPSAGAATLSPDGTTVRFTPPTGFNGQATLAYSVTTSCNAVGTGVITITVNRGPTANPDSVAGGRNTPTQIPFATLLTNDTDPDAGAGDQLRLVSVGSPVNGAVSINAGAVIFNPATGAGNPQSASFSYVIEDEGGLQATAVVTIAIGNSAPVAVPDTRSILTNETSTFDVVANDTDADGDPLMLTGVLVVSPADAGTASIVGTSIGFESTSGRVETVQITYTVTDGQASDTGTYTIAVGDRPPIANNDNGGTVDLLSCPTQPSISHTVTANDIDPDGSEAGIVLVGANVAPAFGTVSVVGNAVVFIARCDVAAPTAVVITYTIRDERGSTATGTLEINVVDSTPPPTPPTTTPATTPVTAPIP